MQYCLIEVFSFSLSMKKFTKGFLSLIIWEMSNTHEVSLLHKDTFAQFEIFFLPPLLTLTLLFGQYYFFFFLFVSIN